MLMSKFVPDIIIFIKKQQGKGREKFLMINANEEIGINSKGIATLLSECSLTDLLQHMLIDRFTTTQASYVTKPSQLHITGVQKQ